LIHAELLWRNPSFIEGTQMKTKATPDDVQGEGNYKAAKQYGDSVKSFVESGKVEKAMKANKEVSPAQLKAMDNTEVSVTTGSGKKKK
jgi:hypothetical protein